ncbi:hypothetical protein B0T19DRAFT_399951 [Cercophora scortea]|uniref:2EXR domain-containing protein n=1 Tax=Cercophora scortea TaxID=314031 RepID=A0AAE0IKX1_9PEZI|nr:hypothetical protein B0T19DRAFT_399951 [Cercophora scortea]
MADLAGRLVEVKERYDHCDRHIQYDYETTEFPQFTSFPAEIRAQIWEHAIWTKKMDRIIPLGFHVDDSRPSPDYVVMFANTEPLLERRRHLRSLLLACRESHGEVRRLFPDSLPIRCVMKPMGHRYREPRQALLPFHRVHDSLAIQVALEYCLNGPTSPIFGLGGRTIRKSVYIQLGSNDIGHLDKPCAYDGVDPGSLMKRLEAELGANAPTYVNVTPGKYESFYNRYIRVNNGRGWACVLYVQLATPEQNIELRHVEFRRPTIPNCLSHGVLGGSERVAMMRVVRRIDSCYAGLAASRKSGST